MEPLFYDRAAAGRELADKLADYANRLDIDVLALPRGGVPVAFEVARALNVPLDVFIVRKLGVPGYEELAMGAIASGGIRVLNEDAVREFGIPDETIDRVAACERNEIARRERLYRGDRSALDLRGQTVILVDDGLATGSTMRAAIAALKTRHPVRVVVAVPVGAPETCAVVEQEADELICLHMPQRFYAVGVWYENFSQTTDLEVRELLSESWSPQAPMNGDEQTSRTAS